MGTAVASGSAASAQGTTLAPRTSNRASGGKRNISDDVMKVHALAGYDPDKLIPSDPNKRPHAMAAIRSELKDAYGMHDELLGRLIAKSRQENGGGYVRGVLEDRWKSIIQNDKSMS